MFDSYSCKELTTSFAIAQHLCEPCRGFISDIVPRLINLCHIQYLGNICILGELLFSDSDSDLTKLSYEFA